MVGTASVKTGTMVSPNVSCLSHSIDSDQSLGTVWYGCMSTSCGNISEVMTLMNYATQYVATSYRKKVLENL